MKIFHTKFNKNQIINKDFNIIGEGRGETIIENDPIFS